MKKVFILKLFLLIIATNSYADCTAYEYAELKDMTKADLIAECKLVNKQISRLLKLPSDNELDMKIKLTRVTVCMEQDKRISRIYKNKYKKELNCKDVNQ